MTVLEQTRLKERVAELLQADPAREWEMPELERSLAAEGFAFNTFDARDAVWALIGCGKAELTSRLLIKAGRRGSP